MNLSPAKYLKTQLGVSGFDRRTLALIFTDPSSLNLAWLDIISLMRRIGTVEERYNDWFLFQLGNEKYEMKKPNGKHLTAPEVLDMRHFVGRAGLAPTSRP